MLTGLKVAVDVQHLYKIANPNDRGSVYTLANGTHTDEASASFQYAVALKAYLAWLGAEVLGNDPARGVMVGSYPTRNRAAVAWGAHLYLACHVNAGGGDYSLGEYISLTDGKPVAEAIAKAVADEFPKAIGSHQSRALNPAKDRGAICIKNVSPPALAVICEPFFGDRPLHQALLAAPELQRLGVAIGDGVSTWWGLRPQ